MEVDERSMLDSISAWVLRRVLCVAVLGLCLAQLATWVPHFLTWPLFSDHDVFATLAFSWESGRVPYRDCLSDNFPGAIYAFWGLGKVFGWGRTWPVFAADAACVVLLGAGMLVWSRRRLGGFLPGAVGWAAFVSYYLGLDHSLVAQRDWHAPLLMVLGIGALECLPAAVGIPSSALAAASALCVRPQASALVPALVLALVQRVKLEASWGKAAGRLAVWVLLAMALSALAFAPIAASGAWPDFVREVRLVAYGSHYNQASLSGFVRQVVQQALDPRLTLVPACLVLLGSSGGPAALQSRRVWLLATLGAWFYRPLSPVPWPYLAHPMALVVAIDTALVVHLLLAAQGLAPSVRLSAVVLAMVAAGIEFRPEYCSARKSLDALRALRQGTEPMGPPLGYHEITADVDQPPYRWDEYRRLLDYLRRQTDPQTQVANLLRVPPALTGPAARLSAMPAESLAWLIVDPSSEARFEAALREAADPAVVWVPAEAGLPGRYRLAPTLHRLEPLLRAHYAPAARFGRIEVWRRR